MVWRAAPIIARLSGTTAPRRLLPDTDEPVEVDHASAACWLMRTADFRALGGFDPAFHPAYFEDVDFGWRARLSGHRITYSREAAVRHRSAATSGRLGNYERGVLFFEREG